jgi:hypothetical protein
MPDFFGQSSSSLANFINILEITICFNSKQCGGTPSDQYPLFYISTYSGSPTSPPPYAINETFRDTALAYFSPPYDTPTNQSTLDQLVDQFRLDYLNWKQLTFDYTFIGICNFAQSGLVDTYEFTYINGMCSTRLYTYPFNNKVHELGHFDWTNDCPTIPDPNSQGQTIPNFDGSPHVAYYGPPAQCVNGALQLTRYYLDLQDGRLKKTYASSDSVS